MAEIIRDTWPNIYRPPLDNSLNTNYNRKVITESIMNIQIYKRPGCSYCDKIDELMRHVEIEPEIIIVSEDISLSDFKEKFPNATGVPHVIIDGKEIGGLVETVKYFVEKGLVSSKK